MPCPVAASPATTRELLQRKGAQGDGGSLTFCDSSVVYIPYSSVLAFTVHEYYKLTVGSVICGERCVACLAVPQAGELQQRGRGRGAAPQRAAQRPGLRGEPPPEQQGHTALRQEQCTRAAREYCFPTSDYNRSSVSKQTFASPHTARRGL